MLNLLDEGIKQKLSEVFRDLEKPVTLVFFQDIPDCEYCSETLDLLKAVTQISSLLNVVSFDIKRETEKAMRFSADKTPFISIAMGAGEALQDDGVHFAGIPVGHEFSAFVSSILMVSKQRSNLSQETKDFLKQLDQPIDLQIFSTPTCPYCPRVISLAQQMALENRMVTATAIEALEFPEMSAQYNISGVPHTVVNFGKATILGAVPEQ